MHENVQMIYHGEVNAHFLQRLRTEWPSGIVGLAEFLAEWPNPEEVVKVAGKLEPELGYVWAGCAMAWANCGEYAYDVTRANRVLASVCAMRCNTRASEWAYRAITSAGFSPHLTAYRAVQAAAAAGERTERDQNKSKAWGQLRQSAYTHLNGKGWLSTGGGCLRWNKTEER